MKKSLVAVLALCLCFAVCAPAMAEAEPASYRPNEIEVQISFEGVSVEVSSSAIGFLIPADFSVTALSDEETARGMIVKAADAAQTYTLEAALTEESYESLLARLQADGSISGIKDYRVNGNDYLYYSIPNEHAQIGVVFLGENSDQALSFRFVIPSGASIGSIPLEIMGSLYEL